MIPSRMWHSWSLTIHSFWTRDFLKIIIWIGAIEGIIIQHCHDRDMMVILARVSELFLAGSFLKRCVSVSVFSVCSAYESQRTQKKLRILWRNKSTNLFYWWINTVLQHDILSYYITCRENVKKKLCSKKAKADRTREAEAAIKNGIAEGNRIPTDGGRKLCTG